LRPNGLLRRMRAVHVIIVTTMLAVPASAFALTGATTATGQSEQNPLNLRLNPGRVTFGDAVRVTGTAPAADVGKQVLLETAARTAPSWRQTAATTVGTNGAFRFRVVPRRSSFLRVVVQAPSSSVPVASAAAADTSSEVPSRALRVVTVTARFAIAHHQVSVLGGGPVHVGGKLLPEDPGRFVRLQGHTSRGWRTVATGHTGARGGFRLRYTPLGGAGQRLRMVFAGDGRNGRSVQPAGTVTVFDQTLASWYDDAGNTACGFHAGLGVANKTLPCGTKVAFHYGGRTVTATVDDRGPYVGGREWDLNQNTAAALGFSGVGTVWSST
jgi:rare lipoprotein A